MIFIFVQHNIFLRKFVEILYDSELLKVNNYMLMNL